MDERRVAVLSMMETSKSTGDIDHMDGSKTVQPQRDRRVHEREEGGRLVDDGDIHIDGRDIDIDHMEARPYNGNETERSVKGWKVAVWPMMETSIPKRLLLRGRTTTLRPTGRCWGGRWPSGR
jgi:hypothetical protein